MVPSEKEGEPFEEAMARVRRCIGGGQGLGVDDDDGDSDLEVVAESITVNLRCPVRRSFHFHLYVLLSCHIYKFKEHGVGCKYNYLYNCLISSLGLNTFQNH
jgi:hypothetical protein